MPSRLQVAKLGDHAHRHQEVHRLHELAYRGLAACGVANGIAGRYEMCAEGPSTYPQRKAVLEKSPRSVFTGRGLVLFDVFATK